MKLIVNRFKSDSDTTLSIIGIQTPHWQEFECFGLEDEYRKHKVSGETRIPAGEYKVRLRQHGGFHDRYKHRFAAIHDGMLEIMDVPGFTDILIHCGNTDEDTSGCLLVGTGAVAVTNDMIITSSAAAYRKLYGTVVAVARAGELLIRFIDNDGA